MKELIEAAKKARKDSYCPYSGFSVGAAILSKDGSIFSGCNIENSSYGATVCAERVALFKAVSEGKREFSAIAIAGGKSGELDEICPPCGICRQTLSEFFKPNAKVYLVHKNGAEEITFEKLFPLGFSSDNIR